MPLFHFPDSGLFQTDSPSWVRAGLIVVVIANLYANRSQRTHRRTPDQSGPSTCSQAPVLGGSMA